MSSDQRAAALQIERKFREQFKALLSSIDADPTKEQVDLTGFEFPSMGFFGRRFNKRLVFSYATFRQGVVFCNAYFESPVLFNDATFVEQVDFGNAHFASEVAFDSSSFLNGADFTDTDFAGETSFAYARFAGRSTFLVQSELGSEPWSSAAIDFRALSIDSGAEVIFSRQNLAAVSFLDTNLERLTFSDIRWYRHRRRQALSDEFRDELFRKREFEKIAANYRELVLNYEAKRDFETAEDFHVGEMEIRRKKIGSDSKWLITRKLREWLNAYSLYWLSSRYGTSYPRAIGVLVLLVFLFAGIFLYTGLAAKTDGASAPREIAYSLTQLVDRFGPAIQLVSDYGKALLYTCSILVFERQRLYEPIGPWSQFWTYVATVIFSAQGALILFAIRRRFSR